MLLPSLSSLEKKYLNIKYFQLDYSNIIFYSVSIFIIVYWYYVTDDFLYIHTFLNDIIFFIIVYFIVHKLNLKIFML